MHFLNGNHARSITKKSDWCSYSAQVTRAELDIRCREVPMFFSGLSSEIISNRHISHGKRQAYKIWNKRLKQVCELRQKSRFIMLNRPNLPFRPVWHMWLIHRISWPFLWLLRTIFALTFDPLSFKPSPTYFSESNHLNIWGPYKMHKGFFLDMIRDSVLERWNEDFRPASKRRKIYKWILGLDQLFFL